MHDYTRNFAFLLAQARTPYFMWAAHDDVRDLNYLEEAVAALEANPRAILAFGQLVEMVDGRPWPLDLAFVNSGLSVAARLRQAALFQLHHLYGVWRTEKLRTIPWRHVNWWHDTPLMMAATMLGDFVRVPGVTFTYLYNTHPFFSWSRQPGLAGARANARHVAERSRDLARLVYLSLWTVTKVAGPTVGLLAGWYAVRKVLDQAVGYTLRRL